MLKILDKKGNLITIEFGKKSSDVSIDLNTMEIKVAEIGKNAKKIKSEEYVEVADVVLGQPQGVNNFNV